LAPGRLSLATVSLRHRKRDYADRAKQKQVKRTANQMRFSGGINLFFHSLCPSDFELEGITPGMN
jgi:hypothetical protein